LPSSSSKTEVGNYRIGAHSSIGMVPAPIASKYNLLDPDRRMSLKGTISQKKVL
jgi:hypothetical protein